MSPASADGPVVLEPRPERHPERHPERRFGGRFERWIERRSERAGILARMPGTQPPRRPERSSEIDVPVFRTGVGASELDPVVVEEPLEVRVGTESLLVTMRTPGADLDLVRGLLFTEGIVRSPDDVAAVAHCADVPPEAVGNVVTVSLRDGATIDEQTALRVGLVSSACGVCGKATLEAVSQEVPVVQPGPRLSAELLSALPAALRGGQSLFDRTGGLHAAGLFDADGRMLALAEDVGRHNAVDKVIGEALRFGRLPLHDTILTVSGRAGFEIVHKARRARIPVLASVSAPSSLAVALARDGGQTLVGFLREGRFNVYCGGERFDPPLGFDPPVGDPPVGDPPVGDPPVGDADA